MPRSFASYGLAETSFAEFSLEDPLLFDELLARMVEDLALASYINAMRNRQRQMSRETVEQTNRLLRIPGPESQDSPRGLQEYLLALTHDLSRAPLSYTDEGLEWASGTIAGAAFLAFATGAEIARAEGDDTVKLRHWLPACEQWPFPLNRFC